MLKVVCALIVSNRKILITQNSSGSDHPFEWEFAGGKIKSGESAENAILREIREELEIEIEIQEKIKSITFDYGFKQIELIPFLCSVKKGEIKLNEHAAFRWILVEELNTIDFSGADKKLIQHAENISILKEYIGKQMHHSR
jgi:8-oxo-dGTP diphosphatase